MAENFFFNWIESGPLQHFLVGACLFNLTVWLQKRLRIKMSCSILFRNLSVPPQKFNEILQNTSFVEKYYNRYSQKFISLKKMNCREKKKEGRAYH